MNTLLLFLLSIVLAASASPGHPRQPAAAHSVPTVLLGPLAHVGRCSGDAYCTACSNCSHCAHCAGGGGTCGVCASYSPPKPTYSPARRSVRSRRSYGGSGSSSMVPATPALQLEVDAEYYISASTLNLRAEPSADAEMVQVLHRNDLVTVQGLMTEKWAKVRAATEAGEVEGYVSRTYLSGSPVAE